MPRVPSCPRGVIDRLLAALESATGAVPVLPVVDTLARGGGRLGDAGAARRPGPGADAAGLPLRRDPRRASRLGRAPTPTDDAQVAARGGHRGRDWSKAIRRSTSSPTPADFARAEQRLAARLVSRTGLGFDVHAFAAGEELWLGGVADPARRGPRRAIATPMSCSMRSPTRCSARSAPAISATISRRPIRNGAAPPRRCSSTMPRDAGRARRAGGSTMSTCTLICEAPKIGPHRDAMRARIADSVAACRRRRLASRRRPPSGSASPAAAKGSPRRRSRQCSIPEEIMSDSTRLSASRRAGRPRPREVVEANRAAGRRIAVAESCTGGLVAAALTEIPGSSDVFEARLRHLFERGQDRRCSRSASDVLETFGAVSIATAWAMAQGALDATGRRCRGRDHRHRRAGRRQRRRSRSAPSSSRAPRRDADPDGRRRRHARISAISAAAACGFRRRCARSNC